MQIILEYDENTQSVMFNADRPISASLAISIMSTVITDLARRLTVKVQSQPAMSKDNVRLLQKLQNS